MVEQRVTKHAADAKRPPTSQRSGSHDTLVFIVDDDLGMRDALGNLLQSVGHRVEVFSSASDLLQSKLPDIVSCIVLDVRLPGLSGLDLQTELADAGIRIPVIFITGYGDTNVGESDEGRGNRFSGEAVS